MGRCSILVPSPTDEQYFRCRAPVGRRWTAFPPVLEKPYQNQDLAAALAYGQRLGDQELLAWLRAEHVLPPLE